MYITNLQSTQLYPYPHECGHHLGQSPLYILILCPILYGNLILIYLCIWIVNTPPSKNIQLIPSQTQLTSSQTFPAATCHCQKYQPLQPSISSRDIYLIDKSFSISSLQWYQYNTGCHRSPISHGSFDPKFLDGRNSTNFCSQ